MQSIRLFCIDEVRRALDAASRSARDVRTHQVHLLNDRTRGPYVEAVVSRMKTLRQFRRTGRAPLPVRFIAVSATIPNAEDVSCARCLRCAITQRRLMCSTSGPRPPVAQIALWLGTDRQPALCHVCVAQWALRGGRARAGRRRMIRLHALLQLPRILSPGAPGGGRDRLRGRRKSLQV